MNTLEIIDRLCAVNEEQSRIIRELFAFIDEQMTVDEAVKESFAEKCRTVETESGRIDDGLRSLLARNCGKEFRDG